MSALRIFPRRILGGIRGREAGFSEVREVFVAPDDLYRMYLFRGQAGRSIAGPGLSCRLRLDRPHVAHLAARQRLKAGMKQETRIIKSYSRLRCSKCGK
jgi:hypothetical protein